MANTLTKYEAALNTLDSNTYDSYGRYWHTYNPTYVPTTYISYPVPSREAARYRFALELIAHGGFTKEQMVQIVREALKQ